MFKNQQLVQNVLHICTNGIVTQQIVHLKRKFIPRLLSLHSIITSEHSKNIMCDEIYQSTKQRFSLWLYETQSNSSENVSDTDTENDLPFKTTSQIFFLNYLYIERVIVSFPGYVRLGSQIVIAPFILCRLQKPHYLWPLLQNRQVMERELNTLYSY